MSTEVIVSGFAVTCIAGTMDETIVSTTLHQAADGKDNHLVLVYPRPGQEFEGYYASAQTATETGWVGESSVVRGESKVEALVSWLVRRRAYSQRNK